MYSHAESNYNYYVRIHAQKKSTVNDYTNDKYKIYEYLTLFKYIIANTTSQCTTIIFLSQDNYSVYFYEFILCFDVRMLIIVNIYAIIY